MICRCAHLLAALLALSGAAAAVDTPSLVIVQASPSDPARSRLVHLSPSGKVTVLTPSFTAAADPCVSFDGRRILFAGKRAAGDTWDLWEIGTDGGDLVRITEDPGDIREPVYLPRAAVTPPEFDVRVRWIAFTRSVPGILDEQGRRPLASLYAMNLDPLPDRDRVLWRTTYNLGGDGTPTVMSDGRVLHAAIQRGRSSLMTISWAGENLNTFYGSHDSLSQTDPCELPDRSVVFVESRDPADRAGRLARVYLRRPLHSHEVLTGPDRRFRSPHPHPSGGILVAVRETGKTWDIARFDLAKSKLRSVYRSADWDEIEAVALAVREVPIARIPTVDFASVLDVGSLQKAGQLTCLNVYESDRNVTEPVEPGTVASVRFTTGTPAEPSSEGNGDDVWPPPGVVTRVLGRAPVEPDGSFLVNIPGDVPFYLELLDAHDRVVKTMKAWTWVRTGDQRGCIGCHEDRELTPENRATQALLRGEPTTVGRSDLSAVGEQSTK